MPELHKKDELSAYAYVQPPWATITHEDINQHVESAFRKVSQNGPLYEVYNFLSDNTELADSLGRQLFKGVTIGMRGFYEKLEKNWHDIANNLNSETKERILLAEHPSEYLLSYGHKYETKFGDSVTDPRYHLGFTLLGTFWRDTALVNLHYTFFGFKEINLPLFLTLSLSQNGPNILTDYAFDTHPISYANAGIHYTSISDLLTAFEIAIEDFGSLNSVLQVLRLAAIIVDDPPEPDFLINPWILDSPNIIRRDQDFISRVMFPKFEFVEPNRAGTYFYNMFVENVPSGSATVPRPPDNLQSPDQVRDYAYQLIERFSPTIARAGTTVEELLIAYSDRLNRVKDRVKNIVYRLPRQLWSLLREAYFNPWKAWQVLREVWAVLGKIIEKIKELLHGAKVNVKFEIPIDNISFEEWQSRVNSKLISLTWQSRGNNHLISLTGSSSVDFQIADFKGVVGYIHSSPHRTRFSKVINNLSVPVTVQNEGSDSADKLEIPAGGIGEWEGAVPVSKEDKNLIQQGAMKIFVDHQFVGCIFQKYSNNCIYFNNDDKYEDSQRLTELPISQGTLIIG